VPPLFIEEPKLLENTKDSANENQSRKTKLGELLKIYGANAFCWLGVQTMFVYIFAFIQFEMAPMSNEEIGKVIALAFMVLNTVGFVLPAPILQPLSKKFGAVKVHSSSMLLMAIGYLSITILGTTPMMLYILMGVVGIGWAATVSLPFAIMTEKVNKSRMGLFMGVFNLSIVIPQLIVSLGFGHLIKNADDKNIIFIICTVALTLSALLWTFVKESSVRNSEDVVISTQH
jgi:MFS family permease